MESNDDSKKLTGMFEYEGKFYMATAIAVSKLEHYSNEHNREMFRTMLTIGQEFRNIIEIPKDRFDEIMSEQGDTNV